MFSAAPDSVHLNTAIVISFIDHQDHLMAHGRCHLTSCLDPSVIHGCVVVEAEDEGGREKWMGGWWREESKLWTCGRRR